MYVQAMLSAGTVVSLFAFARRPAAVLLAAACSVLLLLQDYCTSLLVDAMLSYVALAGLALCIYVCIFMERRSEMVWASVPYTIFLVTIKNSGVLLALFIVAYILVFFEKSKKTARTLVISSACPLLTLALWQKHVKLVYSNGLSTKHSMSLSHMLSIIGEKTAADVRSVIVSYLHTMFSSSKIFFLLAVLAILYVFYRYCLRSDRKATLRHAVFLLSIYLAYMAGMLGMYLFSMPGGEALGLSSFSRYHRTMLLIVAGALAAAAVMGIERAPAGKRRLASLAPALLLLTCLYLVFPPASTTLRRQQLAGTQRARFDELIRENNIPSGKSYLVIVSNDFDRKDYVHYMAAYLFSTDAALARSPEDLLSDLSLMRGRDYLIILDETEDTRALVELIYGDPDLRVVEIGASS